MDMQLFGHPIHPLMIHFPTALLPMDFVLSILFETTGSESFYKAGFYCLAGAVIMGVLAIITGLIDLLGIPAANKKAQVAALYHGSVNALVIIAYIVITYKAYEIFPEPYLAGQKGIIIKGIWIAGLFLGNYMGGALIYKHHVGISNEIIDHGKTDS